jgi:hypothetical protein
VLLFAGDDWAWREEEERRLKKERNEWTGRGEWSPCIGGI